MKIYSLRLLTKNVTQLQQFYVTILGLPLLESSKDKFTVLAGQSYLTFEQTETIEENPYYHFAFDIPHNKIDESITWLKSKNISINLLHNSSYKFYSDTWNSTSIYFYDPSGNIVEFIARHSLNNEVVSTFSSKNILNISEMGLVVNNVTDTKKILNNCLNLDTYKNSTHSFAAVGDETGLFILCSDNRIWLGSDKKANIFKTEVVIEGHVKGTFSLDPYPYTIIAR